MNAMRLLAVGAIVCLLSAGLRDEDKTDYAKLMVGKWECSKADEGTLPVGSKDEFNKDGKITVAAKMGDKEEVMTGTYTVKEKTFSMVLKSGDMEHKMTITIKKIDDKTMTTANEEGKIVELSQKK